MNNTCNIVRHSSLSPASYGKFAPPLKIKDIIDECMDYPFEANTFSMEMSLKRSNKILIFINKSCRFINNKIHNKQK